MYMVVSPTPLRTARPPVPSQRCLHNARHNAKQQASASIAHYSAATTAQRGVVFATHARTTISEAIAALPVTSAPDAPESSARIEQLAERGSKPRLSDAKAARCRVDSSSPKSATASRSPGHRARQHAPAAHPTMKEEAEIWGRLWNVPPAQWTDLQARCFFISHLPQLHLPQIATQDSSPEKDSVESTSSPAGAGSPAPTAGKRISPCISPRARAAEKAALAQWPLHENEDPAAIRRQRIREAFELAAQPRTYPTRSRISEAREHLSAAQKKARRRARARAAAEWVAPDVASFAYNGAGSC